VHNIAKRGSNSESDGVRYAVVDVYHLNLEAAESETVARLFFVDSCFFEQMVLGKLKFN
jgi:hypothetical protein